MSDYSHYTIHEYLLYTPSGAPGFVTMYPGVPMRLKGLGTNLAKFIDLESFSKVLEEEEVAALAHNLEEIFDCLARTMDGSEGKTGFSILGNIP